MDSPLLKTCTTMKKEKTGKDEIMRLITRHYCNSMWKMQNCNNIILEGSSVSSHSEIFGTS